MRGKGHRVYLLGHELPPEVIATAFAKTSRSPQPFDEIAKELSEEFHERWVVGFGHSSIAEHAVLHVAIENLSRLAAEALESCRLCSFTEKSSRYQPFHRFHVPERIESSEYAELYRRTCDELFALYRVCLEKVRALMAERHPRGADESEKAYESRLRGRYYDVCRFLLPTAALANVGLTANARALEWLITKLLSHPLAEVRELGEELKEVALQEAPTLVKYAAANSYLMEAEKELSTCTRVHVHTCTRDAEAVRLIGADGEAEERLVAALLYRFSCCSHSELLERARRMSSEERERVIDAGLRRLGPHDRPLRELEHIYYTFEIVADQGAYRDLARHRMMTLTAGPPTVTLGYAIPRAIEEAGLREEYERVLDGATAAYRMIYAKYPEEAAYLVTNAHNRRFLVTLNLRELYHLVGLRSRPEGHFSYRRIALKIYELVRERHPLLLKYLPFAEPPPPSMELEREYFIETSYRSND